MPNEPKMEEAKYWSPRQQDGIECLYGKYFTFTFAPHFHPGYAIGVVESGANVFECRGQEHIATVGDVMLFNPEEVHTGKAADKKLGLKFRMLFIAPRIFQNICGEICDKYCGDPYFPATVVHDGLTSSKLWSLHSALERQSLVLEQDCLLYAAATRLIFGHSNFAVPDRAVRDDSTAVSRVCEYIAAKACENITLGELAGVAHVSPYHLLRVFRKKMGITPHSYQVQLRVDEAKRLLRRGLPISDVAVATGFFDQAHFSKQFKRYVGVTPGQFLGTTS